MSGSLVYAIDDPDLDDTLGVVQSIFGEHAVVRWLDGTTESYPLAALAAAGLDG